MDTATLNAEPTALFEPGRNCAHLARATRAAPLVDAEAYFRALAHAAERAQDSIIILGWDFDSRTPLDFDGTGPQPSVLLGDLLNDLVRRRPRLRIYILIWAGAALRIAAPYLGLDYVFAVSAAGALWAGGFALFAVLYAPVLLGARRTAGG